MRWLILLALTAAPFANGQVYEWVDENGKRQFSDQPPPGIAPEEKTYEITNIDSNLPAPVAPDYERRRQEAAQAAANDARMKKACRKARRDLRKLRGRVTFVRDDVPVTVSEKDRQLMAEQLEAAIAGNCGQGS